MILVIGGTSDSYQIIESLIAKNKKVLTTVTTDYGQKLIKEKFKIPVLKKRMTAEELLQLIKAKKITEIIDSSHPFAEKITKNALKAAAAAEIEYIRFERENLDLKKYYNSGVKIIEVANYQKAAEKAREYEKIFLTTGSNNIEIFIKEIPNYQKRLFLRIMTFPAFIKKLIKKGIPPANLIAVKGPFNKDFNQAIFKNFAADLVITKASGKSGGLKSKIEAAAELNLTVLVIQRPKINYPKVFNRVDNLIDYI